MRKDGRKDGELRKVKITTGYISHPEGSVLIEMGNTKVICNATVEEKVPPFLTGSGSGWVTAEYAMLPRATTTRNQRDISKLKLSPRSAEIQRLIGRALRGVTDTKALGERTVTVDCDVIQADGGTRCASITGAFAALYIACKRLLDEGKISAMPLLDHVSAISVGMLDGTPMLDLAYCEDSIADTDMNVVMTGSGHFIEIQGTAEGAPFGKDALKKMLALAEKGNAKLVAEQKKALSGLQIVIQPEGD